MIPTKYQKKSSIYTNATFVTKNCLIHYKFWRKDQYFIMSVRFVRNLFDKPNYEKKDTRNTENKPKSIQQTTHFWVLSFATSKL